MPKKNELEFANFILRFGNEKTLLDLVEEIVVPAFTSKHKRTLRKTNNFFSNVTIVNYGSENNPEVCIVGRYIRDTVLSREQVYDPDTNQISKDTKSLKSSPSAMFCLLLKNHKLLYFGETYYAPDIKAFKATAFDFINREYHNFIKQNPNLEIKPPNLEILYLANPESFNKLIDKYSIVKDVQIQFSKTNNEIDNNEFFEKARELGDENDSQDTRINYKNNQKGLQQEAIKEQLGSALSQGNTQIKIKGKDKEHNNLVSYNENIKVSYRFQELFSDIQDFAHQACEKFYNLIEKGTISLPKSNTEENNKANKLKRILNK